MLSMQEWTFSPLKHWRGRFEEHREEEDDNLRLKGGDLMALREFTAHCYSLREILDGRIRYPAEEGKPFAAVKVERDGEQAICVLFSGF